ncbi:MULTISPECIES: hypothetical protein [unclassified Mesorhizobium]|uniref:hypothetical protein n=2 Tax=Mesorhizobium TaxID=68287 RepID=UPI0013E3C911|nr:MULTISPECIES: hypothetical protein [unclassified Mesorhizobium]
MPRAGGVYSAPPGTKGSPNTTIESAKYNALVDDLVADANAARPVTAGGSGSSTAVGGADNFSAAGADMASAATVNLANSTGTLVNITGTVTITALGTLPAGSERDLVFAGVLTLTHNATSLILPGGANIITAAGDVARMRSLGGGNWKCVGYQRAASVPYTDDSPTLNSPAIVGATTISGTAAGPLLTISTTDAGAGTGPNIDLYRNSASPAAADLISQILFSGQDSGANKTSYAEITAAIVDPTNGSEDGRFYIATNIAGVYAVRLYFGAGIYTANATGGDKGVDTVNAKGYYVDGAQIPFSKAFESAQINIVTNTTVAPFPHGLGVQPKLVTAALQCVVADTGYSPGDEVPINVNTNSSSGTSGGISMYMNGPTNIGLRIGNSISIWDKNGGIAGIGPSSWKLVVRAWA